MLNNGRMHYSLDKLTIWSKRMTELIIEKCEACRRDAPKVTDEETNELSVQIPDWNIIEVDSSKRLTRKFNFDNFIDALTFTNRVGEIAESEAHHPAILTEWGSVEVTWWTHKIKGLHRNDFIMAAKTDAISI